VRWGVAGNIVVAWVLTLPASAIVAAVTYELVSLLGADSAGPIVVSAGLLIALAAVFGRRVIAGRTLTAEA
jgi:hypothetical protein